MLMDIVSGQIAHSCAYHFLVQTGHHVLQLLVSFLQVFLCSLQSVQFGLCSVHLLLHSPAQFIAHS